jgi:hypothetical protein
MAETKIDNLVKIVKYNSSLSDAQIKQLAEEEGCSERTVYRALERVREATKKKLSADNRKKKKKSKKSSKKKTKKTIPRKKKHTNKNVQNVNPIIPKTFQPKEKPQIPRIPSDMPFEHFCKYHSYPHYDGLYRWQSQWAKGVWKYETSLTLVSRDHGKSIGHGNLCQWSMSSKGYDVLYLGWTSRRKEIADYAYTFFLQRNELVIDKASSNYHFKTVYGTAFDTFSVKSKEILGMHEMGALEREITDENRYLEDFVRNSENPLLLIIDDAIDNTFKDERHKEQKLEDFFESTIISINPNKLMIVGTKKFKEDFYEFIRKKYEEDIFLYIRTPFLPKEDERYGNEPDNPFNLTCPERWIHQDDPQYPVYLELKKKKKLGIPVSSFKLEERKLVRKIDLFKKKKAVRPYWWSAEYMQNPTPITGEIWKKVFYEQHFKGTAAYDLVCLTIDRATTTNAKSDETGIVEFFREKGTGTKVVTNDFTRKINILDLDAFVDRWYRNFLKTYRGAIKVKIVVEKQGGGDDFIALAENAGRRYSHCIIPIHNTRDKMERIQDNLETPINNAQIVFMQSLEKSKVVEQILTAPYMDYKDAIDALSNGSFEIDKLPVVDYDADLLAAQLQHFRQNQEQDQSAKYWITQALGSPGRNSIF